MNINELPKGITVRTHNKSEVIQIFFMYRNVRCREIIPLPPTKENIKRAFNKRNLILAEIEAKTFDYAKYFPNSPKVELFSENANKHLMSDLLNRQLEDYRIMEERGNLSISTYKGYKRVNNILLGYFSDIYIEDLTSQQIKDFMVQQGLNKISPKTMRNRLSLLKMVLEEAINDGLITYNPLDGISLQKQINRTTTETDYEVEPLTEDEKNLIINFSDGQAKNLIQFNLWAGLRISELIALKWCDIDFDNGIINIQRAKVEGKEKTTKTKAGIRKIIMLPKAREALLAQRLFTESEVYVFHNSNTNKPWSHSSKVAEMWKRVLSTASVKYRNAYQMRHTYASTLLSNGENVFWLATQMGHENTEMIFKHYGKWIPQKQKNGYEFVGKY